MDREGRKSSEEEDRQLVVGRGNHVYSEADIDNVPQNANIKVEEVTHTANCNTPLDMWQDNLIVIPLNWIF